MKLFQRYQTFIKVEGLLLNVHLAIDRRKIGGTESKELEVHINVPFALLEIKWLMEKKGWE